MKAIVIYYSMLGNTEYVANYISKKVNCDLLRIEPEKEYPTKGIGKFFHAGRSSVMEELPKLKEYRVDLDKYDYIIFGSPVWASNFVPPLRTFIKENKDKLVNKKISVFFSFSGGGADKAEEKLKDYLKINNFENRLVLINPKLKYKKENDERIDKFCNSIKRWLYVSMFKNKY